MWTEDRKNRIKTLVSRNINLSHSFGERELCARLYTNVFGVYINESPKKRETT